MAEFIVDDRILKAAGSSATYTTSVEESEYFVERDSLARERRLAISNTFVKCPMLLLCKFEATRFQYSPLCYMNNS